MYLWNYEYSFIIPLGSVYLKLGCFVVREEGGFHLVLVFLYMYRVSFGAASFQRGGGRRVGGGGGAASGPHPPPHENWLPLENSHQPYIQYMYM